MDARRVVAAVAMTATTVLAGSAAAMAEPTAPSSSTAAATTTPVEDEPWVYELTLISVRVVDVEARTIAVTFSSPNPDDHGVVEWSSDTDETFTAGGPRWRLPEGSDRVTLELTVPDGADRLDITYQTENYDLDWLSLPLREHAPELFEGVDAPSSAPGTTSAPASTSAGPAVPGTVQTDDAVSPSPSGGLAAAAAGGALLVLGCASAQMARCRVRRREDA